MNERPPFAYLTLDDLLALAAPEDAAYALVIAVATGRMAAEESADLLAGWVQPR